MEQDILKNDNIAKVEDEWKKLVDYLNSHFKMRLDDFINDDRYIRYREDAHFIRNLRNLIAHNREFVEINDKGVKRIEDFVNLITDTLECRMIPIEGLFTASLDDYVLPFLRKLQQKNYTYLPIIDENNVCVEVFSAYVLMAYTCLGKSIDESTTFDDLYCSLTHTPLKGTYTYLPINHPVIEVINTFKVTSDFHLDVVLVTEDGRAESPLLGMITIWDLQ